MNSIQIKMLKKRLANRFPWLYKQSKHVSSLRSLMKQQIRDLIERRKFRRCLSSGKPYFGPVMAARQGVPLRHAYMQALVKLESRGGGGYQILEVGSWAGGSAITWAEAIKKHDAGKGLVFCVDPWIRYHSNPDRGGIYRVMDEALNTGRIFELFLHNIRAAGHENIVRVIRGSSDEILPLLKPSRFDLVFIDGSHAFADMVQDTENAVPLVRDGGILCGDDLELQLSVVDLENARANSEADFILDPKTKQWFHPGVTLAVGEFFGEVSVWEGFWAMRKRGSLWEKVVLGKLDLESVTIPSHLTNIWS